MDRRVNRTRGGSFHINQIQRLVLPEEQLLKHCSSQPFNVQPSTKPSLILFDVNETLLDMDPVKKKINSLLGSKLGFRIWFGMLLQYSLVDNTTSEYHDFSTIGSAALDMAAMALDEKPDNDDKLKALSLMEKLPPYKDVEKGLKMLQTAGFRLAVLTNSSAATLRAQLEYASLGAYFEATVSVEAVKKFKPAPETYQLGAQTLGVAPGEVIMIAAHGWDIAGALKAGMQAGFIQRKGQSLYPLAPHPRFMGNDLIEVAEGIIKFHA